MGITFEGIEGKGQKQSRFDRRDAVKRKLLRERIRRFARRNHEDNVFLKTKNLSMAPDES